MIHNGRCIVEVGQQEKVISVSTRSSLKVTVPATLPLDMTPVCWRWALPGILPYLSKGVQNKALSPQKSSPSLGTTVAFLVFLVKLNFLLRSLWRFKQSPPVGGTAFWVQFCCLGLSYPSGLSSSWSQVEPEVGWVPLASGFLETDWERLIAPITSSAPHLYLGNVLFLIGF